MLGLLYLLWIFIIGYYLMLKFTPWFDHQTLGDKVHEPLPSGRPRVPAWMFQLPFAWVLGALVVNWTNFFLCNFTGRISSTLMTMTAAGAVAIWIVLSERKKTESVFFSNLRRLWHGTGTTEIIYLLLVLALAAYTNMYTLADNGKEIQFAASAFGDLVVHTSLIHSFSLSDNFPPQYPYFAAGDMPYHFLFQFLAASLEHLGMPFVAAFNSISIISLTALLLLVYVLATRISGLKSVAYLTLTFIFLRSSFAFFDFAESYHYSFKNILEAIGENEIYIGDTPNARWGMWTFFNTLSNQRHLAIGIAAVFIASLLMLPLVEEKLDQARKKIKLPSWKIEHTQRAVFIGCFLGAIAFWNGATLIAALLVLAGFALTSRHKTEYIIIAVIAVVLAVIQSKWFISPEKTPVQARFVFGFLAADKSILGVLKYILKAYGLLIPLFILSLIYFRKYAFLGLAFAFPFIFAFTVQPTVDMPVNHKFIMVSQCFMYIFIAWMMVDAWRKRGLVAKVGIASAFSLMTITGIVDAATFHNVNSHKYGQEKNNPVTLWILKNTPKKSIFLTEVATINPVLYAGRLTYLGWPYYGWSAGYDTTGREADVRKIYGAGTKEDLAKAIKNTPIDYILVNDTVRSATNYVINENAIADSYQVVFETDSNNTKIYKVTR